jgi:hypothetical protein
VRKEQNVIIRMNRKEKQNIQLFLKEYELVKRK